MKPILRTIVFLGLAVVASCGARPQGGSMPGRWLVFASDRPGGAGRHDIYLYDRPALAFVPLPGLNTDGDELYPSFDEDCRYLAFERRLAGANDADVLVYDREAEVVLDIPELATSEYEGVPDISADGRFVTFQAVWNFYGEGGLDVYVYDREQGLMSRTRYMNSPWSDHSPGS